MTAGRSEIDALLADIRQSTQQARQVSQEQQAAREQFGQESREMEDRRAEAARQGEHGRDWQVVQSRIDQGQTTVADVLSGADESLEAQRIQGMTAENLVTITGEMAEHDEATGGERFSGLNETFADLRASLQRAAEAVEQTRSQGEEQP